MSYRPARITQADLNRAIRAIEASGRKVRIRFAGADVIVEPIEAPEPLDKPGDEPAPEKVVMF